MTKEEKIQKIYTEIADKTLRFGCKLLRHTHDGLSKEYYILGPGLHSKRWINSMPFGSMDLEFNGDMISKSSGDWYEVIGHPVMIGDVLDSFDTNHWKKDNFLRTYLRKPIDEQSEECINLIVSIIKPLG